MKYNDNGTIKNIVVKSGDTLPIGTIVDYDGTTVPDGYEEVEDWNSYSTEEHFTGKYWIDGKPIYSKTKYDVIIPQVATTGVNTDNSYELSGIVPDLDTLTNLSGVIPQYNKTIPYVQSSTNFISLFINDSKTHLYIRTNFNAYSGKRVITTIEYTKTTDEATISLLNEVDE